MKKLSSRWRFGNGSEKRIATLHRDLQIIIREVLRLSDYDFSVTDGHRSKEEQDKLYEKKLSRKRGGESLHNAYPSLAVDVACYVDRKLMYDDYYTCYLAGVFKAVSNRLNIPIRWGGNWDGDQHIKIDQKLWDAPHFELVGYAQ